MKSFALAIVLMSILAIASLGMAFEVTVSVSDPAQEQGTYQTVEMKPVQEEGVSSVAQADDTNNEALVAEKE